MEEQNNILNNNSHKYNIIKSTIEQHNNIYEKTISEHKLKFDELKNEVNFLKEENASSNKQ